MTHLDQIIIELLVKTTGQPKDQFEEVIEIPSQKKLGDRALPCFSWAKSQKTSPQSITSYWKKLMMEHPLPDEIEKIECMGGYLNFYAKTSVLAKNVLTDIFKNHGKYGFVDIEGHSPTMIVEFSSPNIAKPFSIGHLRSTNIGASLSRIFSARGWRVIKINHIGDWGTQFGKLMCAYRHWGNTQILNSTPMQALYELYVRFHKEEEQNASLSEEARQWFARLEQGDQEAKELWQWFRDITFQELQKLYKHLNVSFDHYWGESHYMDQLPALLANLEQRNLTKKSDDATIVDLEPHNLPVCLIKKRDESSLYMTRDLAAAIYRKNQLCFDKMLYVVGSPQQLHFQQVFKILELLGHAWASECEHIGFGHISFGDEAMSTRKGNVVFFSEVEARATQMAKTIIQEKNPELENQDEVANQVGLGAVLFADVSSRRAKDVKFSWNEILSFDGETGPYLQYTLVRTFSLLQKYGRTIDGSAKMEMLSSEEEKDVIRTLSFFPMSLARAEKQREPFVIARYLIDLAKIFNRFYNAHRILDTQEEVVTARMYLVFSVSDVLQTGLKLLGMPMPEKM